MSPTWGRLTFAVMIFFRPKPLHTSKRISKCLLPSDVACSVLCARTLESVSASSEENVLVQMCMNRANAAGITPSVDEATAQFSTCAKEKALREAALKDPESEPDLSPNRNFSKVVVKVVDDFEDHVV